MNPDEAVESPRAGLRERKKARTRLLIQQHAIRLFTARGYGDTSIDDIADAAEVSRSTVLRYFSSKADLVIYDDFDERLITAFRAQPRNLNAIQALRATIRGAFATAQMAESLALQRSRDSLMRSVPELRVAMLEELTRTVREIAQLVAERAGRPPNDETVLALSGAVIGVTIAAWFSSDGPDWVKLFFERIETGLRLLEDGFSGV